MGIYKQSCSSCVGRSATAMHDLDRYERDARMHRTAERLAQQHASNPPLRHGGNHVGTAESWQAEADHHGELATIAEHRLTKARARMIAAFSVSPCALCGGTGYILSTGTFVRGAKGAPES